MNITRRKTKKGDETYLIRVSLGYKDGRQIFRSHTYKPQKGMTPKQIEKEVNRQAVLFEEKCKDDYAHELEQEESSGKCDITFRELADEWLELQETNHNLKSSSLLRMKNCRERTYKAFGDLKVSQMTYRKIQAFITSLAKDGSNLKTGKGLSQKTQKHYLTFISDVLLYAKKCGIIEHNPCKDITFRKCEQKEKDIYSLDETKTLIDVIDQKAPTDYKLFINLLAYSGMRRGEALGLEYKDFDFEESILVIRRTSNYRTGYGIYTDTPKTKSSYRVLFLPDKIIRLVKQLYTERREQSEKCKDFWVETDRVFVTWRGEPMHPNTPYTWLQRFCQRENIPFKGLHAFRHFAATQALANGVDIKSVSAMLGHSQTSTTLNVYAHAVLQNNQTALSKVASLLESK